MWGLYLNGELIAEYDVYAEALTDALFVLSEEGIAHEIKFIV